jgi:hypothetical protein
MAMTKHNPMTPVHSLAEAQEQAKARKPERSFLTRGPTGHGTRREGDEVLDRTPSFLRNGPDEKSLMEAIRVHLMMEQRAAFETEERLLGDCDVHGF